MKILLPEGFPQGVAPEVDGDNVSWESRCHPGNWQMDLKSCTLVAMASWIEAVYGNPISDAEVMRVFQRYGTERGVTPETAYMLAKDAGWFPAETRGVIRTKMLGRLKHQPIIATYRYCTAWDHVGRSGRIKSWAGMGKIDDGVKRRAGHSVLIVGHQKKKNGEWIVVEGSGGPTWGRNGFAQLLRVVHDKTIMGMWVVV